MCCARYARSKGERLGGGAGSDHQRGARALTLTRAGVVPIAVGDDDGDDSSDGEDETIAMSAAEEASRRVESRARQSGVRRRARVVVVRLRSVFFSPPCGSA